MSELADKALEARQDATDVAKRIAEDGFSEPARIILNALTLLDSAVIALERGSALKDQKIAELQKDLDHEKHLVALAGYVEDASYDSEIYEVMTEFNDEIGSIAHELIQARSQLSAAQEALKTFVEIDEDCGLLVKNWSGAPDLVIALGKAETVLRCRTKKGGVS